MRLLTFPGSWCQDFRNFSIQNMCCVQSNQLGSVEDTKGIGDSVFSTGIYNLVGSKRLVY